MFRERVKYFGDSNLNEAEQAVKRIILDAGLKTWEQPTRIHDNGHFVELYAPESNTGGLNFAFLKAIEGISQLRAEGIASSGRYTLIGVSIKGESDVQPNDHGSH